MENQTNPEQEGKKTFEVRTRRRPDGTIENAVFIGGEYLDWSMDISSLIDARRMGSKFFQAAIRDIEKHYVESVSEFLGRKVTADEIKKATKTGWI